MGYFDTALVAVSDYFIHDHHFFGYILFPIGILFILYIIYRVENLISNFGSKKKTA